MIAELESIAEGRAWAFRGRRPIGIVRLRWSKPAIAGLDPQQSASRHQLLEFTERRRHRQRIATCDGVPEATLIIVTGAVEDSRSEEHTSELQSLMRISYAVFCLKKK